MLKENTIFSLVSSISVADLGQGAEEPQLLSQGYFPYGCVPFGESKNGFLILDLSDFRGRKEREIRNWICNLGDLLRMLAICMTASHEMRCFLLFDKFCDYTVQNLVVGSSSSDHGTYKTNQERSSLKLKIF